jgi:hypothetical protein
MSASAGEGAKKLGEKLMAEVEVEDLSSVSSEHQRDCRMRRLMPVIGA